MHRQGVALAANWMQRGAADGPATCMPLTLPHKPPAADLLGAQRNRLLASLPQAVLAQLLPRLEWLELPLGAVLYEAGSIERQVYFPTSGIVSLIYIMQNGDAAEIAVVGQEGIVGYSLFLGGDSSPSRAVVQSAGWCYRLNAQVLKDDFERFGPLTHVLLRYAQALITQIAQTAVCNRHHSLDQQLCRWLLLSLDRLPGNEIAMTQELIANMLGVRRQGVTECALRLQEAGLIRYMRGRITVLDRPGLEARVCECYAVVKQEYDRLIPRAAAQGQAPAYCRAESIDASNAPI
jgi:CRP-like cAMP-binding protein